MSTPSTLPRKNMLIGITHLSDGTKLIKEAKVLKVGVGLPRGKAVDLWVDGDGLWNIRQGNSVSGKLTFKTVAKVKTRAEAETAWRAAYEAADLCGYPRKITYFNFSRPIIGRDGAEIYIPDFAATEAYSFADPNRIGVPTEIDVIFLEDNPFNASYQMWSSSELRCSGDGENALRSVQMYDDEKKVPEQLREAWKAAKANGDRVFSVVGGCFTCNCPFSKEKDGKPPACKPSADLKFQLSRTIRVGGTAFFHTSGYRSIVQLFSAVERIKELTGGRIAGVPLKLVLRSYKTNHNGIASLQSGVSLEFRAEDFESVKKNLIDQAYKFRLAAGLPAPTTKMIESGDPTEAFEESPMSAQAMTGEFYPDNDDDSAPEPTSTTNAPATQAASAAKVTEIGEALAKSAVPLPPPASNVVSISPDKAPWAEADRPRVRMTELFQAMLRELGKPAYDVLLKTHGIEGLSKFDAPETLACYRAMEIRARESKSVERTEAPAPDDSKPLF